jgi:hypothetical protein
MDVVSLWKGASWRTYIASTFHNFSEATLLKVAPDAATYKTQPMHVHVHIPRSVPESNAEAILCISSQSSHVVCFFRGSHAHVATLQQKLSMRFDTSFREAKCTPRILTKLWSVVEEVENEEASTAQHVRQFVYTTPQAIKGVQRVRIALPSSQRPMPDSMLGLQLSKMQLASFSSLGLACDRRGHVKFGKPSERFVARIVEILQTA